MVGQAPLQITAVPVDVDAETAFSNQTVATFTDPGIASVGASGPTSQYTSQFVASIDWGDGSGASSGTVTFDPTTGIFSVEGSHTYAATGDYSVNVTVTPQTISVWRIDSSSPTGLTKSPSADFIDQLYTDETNQTAPINTIALPTVSTNSGNRALTTSSLSPSEARIYLSANGQYLVMMGNNDTTADTSPQSYLETPSQVNRVIGTIDAEGDVNTTTALADAYNGDNTRGATSVDGQEFWTDGSAISGNTSAGQGYVHYATLGSTTSTVLTMATGEYNVNAVEIYNGQLYESIRSPESGGDMSGIYQIGTGLPTTSGQAATLFIETPQTNPLDVADSGKATSPYDFYLADLASNSYSINGVNVAYVADGTMGIARYDYDITGGETSAQWNFSYYIDSTGTFASSLHGRQHWANFGDEQLDHDQSPPLDATKAGGVTGLTGEVVNGVVELFAVTGNFGTGSSKNAVPGNKVIEVNDTGESAGYTVLATDSSDSEYRGVAISPSAVVTSSADVAAANQTISFTPPSSPIGFVPNEMVTLSATGGASGNAVVFSIDSSSTGTGTIAGDVLTVTGADNIIIDANQAGNANYNAASQVQQTLVVDAPA